MKKIRGRDTVPEVTFRKALWARGLRYRVCPPHLAGKPDVVLPSSRVAIFVDGDFWHGGQWRRRNLRALEDQFKNTSSRAYWLRKIRRNMRRDFERTAILLSEGWTVLRFWESEIRNDLERCVEMTIRTVNGNADTTNGTSGSTLSLLPRRTFAEFFAGIGLVRMALERQGWSAAFANDIDPKKREMYEGNFRDDQDRFVLEDIHEVSADHVPSVTLATASFPCNDLSLAGSRQGLGGKQSSAFWGYARILEEMEGRRPPLVLLENVAGFLTSHKGADFREALLTLNRLSYSVDAFALDAARFVPQSRPRLFIVGILGDLIPEEVRESFGFYGSDVRPKALAEFILTHPEIEWNIRSLPPQPKRETTLEDILEDLPDEASEWWSFERTEYLYAQMSPRHREIVERFMSESRWSYGTVFRRMRKGKSMAELRTDGIAGCLRTPRGGSGRQILVKAGYGELRARLLTPRECARLMGADDYSITVTSNQALFGFGDAVCVPAIEWIVEHYFDPLINELIRGTPLALAES
jgi:DNA (cytosine-5)-methyltransferase 1